jgi:hypothetical protein
MFCVASPPAPVLGAVTVVPVVVLPVVPVVVEVCANATLLEAKVPAIVSAPRIF